MQFAMYYKKYGIYPLFPNLVSYNDQLAEFNVKTLERRRKVCDVLFVFNILNQSITVPKLMENIYINVPNIRLRKRNKVFNVINNLSPLNRCLEIINNLIKDFPNLDIFTNSSSLLRLLL